MSTRACYRFFPENGPNDFPGVVTVYKHHDGYPSGAAEAIANALPYAWTLPRFEADEFAAAFVSGNKPSADDIAANYESRIKDEKNPETRDALLRMAHDFRTNPIYRECGGGVRLVPFEGLDAFKRFASDIEYLYDIRCVSGKLRITAYATSERDGNWSVVKFFEGSIAQLKRKKSFDWRTIDRAA